jgi:hypothetical protein
MNKRTNFNKNNCIWHSFYALSVLLFFISNIVVGCDSWANVPAGTNHTVTHTPTITPRSTVVATSTFVPKVTPISLINTPSPTLTATATPIDQPPPTPVLPVDDSVTLVEPLDSVLQGRRTFRWSTEVQLEENQYFELVFWPVGRDPMSSSFGPAGSIKETTLTVDLDRIADILPHLFQAGQEYEWGVLLVELNPYRRLQHLGGGHRFLFERSNGGNSSGDGGSAPAPTNTPRG